MTPADKRVMDLLERWLKSIELHLKYADLDEARYRQVQPWPAHERPARWMLELAQQKVLQLQTLCKTRLGQNDAAFSESLELMCFLANLVGAQHIQRFVPLADPSRENAAVFDTGTVEMKTVEVQAAKTPEPLQAEPLTPATRDADSDRTREMPRLKQAKRAQPTTATPVAAAPRAQETAIRKSVHKPPTQTKPTQPPAAKPATGTRMSELVVADAVRLLRWGRQWHELAELIARMAERPASAEVRRILRSHKSAIEAQLAT